MMMKMKLYTIVVLPFILAGCNEKIPKNMDLTKFLSEKNTTRYYYKTTVTNQPQYSEFPMRDLLTETVIIS